MTRRIFKYPLRLHDYAEFGDWHVGAKILCVQMQGDTPCVWAEVDDDDPAFERRSFVFYGTGQSMPRHPGMYVGTIQMHDGALVFHLYTKHVP